jgi:hypothetical protein
LFSRAPHISIYSWDIIQSFIRIFMLAEYTTRNY